MGGRGGYRLAPRLSLRELQAQVAQSKAESQRTAYKADANRLLGDLLTAFNDRDEHALGTHIDAIKDALDQEIEGTIDLVYGGSVSKHTYVDGLSDVDLLVRINDTSLEDRSPEAVRRYLAQRLRERFPNTEVTTGTLSVKIRFSDGHEIQILPALQTSSGIRILTSDGTKWSGVVRPESFARKLTDTNQSCNGRVVPTIKLFKAMQANLPEDARLSGYHVESLAIEAFDGYTGDTSYKSMLQHMTKVAIDRVKTPIKDRTGQSLHVDDNLGPRGSQARQRASAFLERILRRMDAADASLRAKEWERLFKGTTSE